MATTADLANDLGVDKDDVALLPARLDEDDPDLTGDVVPRSSRSSTRPTPTRSPSRL
jgi:hypothetical protein